MRIQGPSFSIHTYIRRRPNNNGFIKYDRYEVYWSIEVFTGKHVPPDRVWTVYISNLKNCKKKKTRSAIHFRRYE